MTSRTWMITGASRGFGRVWAGAALERGDRVALGVRDPSSVADLVDEHPESALAVQVDVTHRDDVHAAVGEVVERFGRLDVIVANAGYGLFGALEETTEEQARRQLEVNVLGTLWLLQAVAPTLRAQGSGRVLVNTSFGGLISYATAGLYGASKYAVEGMGDSFAMEMTDFGTHVTLVEPGAYATDFGGPSAEQSEHIAAYDDARARTGQVFAAMPPGDPQHTADAILRLVDLEEPPRRLLLGAHALPLVLEEYEARMAEWQAHQGLAAGAQ